jgi:hypothetical protein
LKISAVAWAFSDVSPNLENVDTSSQYVDQNDKPKMNGEVGEAAWKKGASPFLPASNLR